ncbi:Oidioi.mRNA.OKI2018_I69.PAR.g12137.t1.cds [Oikopleura dioica]|uniref:Oidioi.mRNA.OKI2018_I69.PAR.g12137.t1.cds n=1 Tax=Oikopleura dioica TaxID=34765 RepID=A0ABN7S6A6_OIKDI|nr:Oidioi.mRNA.OKI2018_I69.PAR.g12137.t1.cds [Oikopleura dioica]
MATIFVDAVKRDYSKFFSVEPDPTRLEHEARQLFRYGFGSFPEKPESKDDSPRERMELSFVDAEKKLMKLGVVTKEKIHQMSKIKTTGYGRSKKWMTKLFVDEVNKDHSVFFPSEPDRRWLKVTAAKLFQYGGTQKFIIKQRPGPDNLEDSRGAESKRRSRRNH